MPRRAIVLVVVCAVLALGAGRSWAEDVSSVTTLPIPTNAVGRFYLNGEMLCTAWAAGSVMRTYPNNYHGPSTNYETRIVTAGHCVRAGFHRDRPTFDWDQPAQNVRYGDTTVRMPAIRVRATLAAYSGPSYGGYDLAVLIVVSPWPVASLIPDFDYGLAVGEKLLVVGYGNGAFLPRVGTFEGREAKTDALIVSGVTSPGTSGGPVLIPGTNRVVGIFVETSISPEDTARGPYWCVLVRCAPQSPGFAAPISGLQGMLRWP